MLSALQSHPESGKSSFDFFGALALVSPVECSLLRGDRFRLSVGSKLKDDDVLAPLLMLVSLMSVLLLWAFTLEREPQCFLCLSVIFVWHSTVTPSEKSPCSGSYYHF